MAIRPDPREVRKFIIAGLPEHGSDIVHATAQAFSISRQSAHAHVAKLVREGVVETQGQTRKRVYRLRLTEATHILTLADNNDEDRVWRRYAAQHLEGLPENVLIICYHGFTEMFNNCIDHSESVTATIQIQRTAGTVTLNVRDTGVGIFEKIRSRFNLDDQRQAILELSKGKLTTDPTRHSGEGIYFTSRMFDAFSILSHSLFFIHNADSDDWLIEDSEVAAGTAITMTIAADSDRTTQQIYDQYVSETDEEEFAFSRTHVPLSLAVYGDENLISRSQAKRVLRRFDRFREVLLDFAGVDSIGQAFADEIFRVFHLSNPSVKVFAMGANKQCQQMIRRAIAARTSPPRSPPG